MKIIFLLLTIILIGGCVESNKELTPIILDIKPDVGTIGTNIVITGTGFTAENNNIAFVLQPENNNNTFNIGYVTGIKSSNGRTIEFVLSDMLGACVYLPTENTICPEIGLLLKSGITYPIYIVNQNGASNSVNFTMTNSVSPKKDV